MTIVAPPQTPEQEDLQALIEEARRRARRRRRSMVVVLLLVVLLGAGSYVLVVAGDGRVAHPARGGPAPGVGRQAFGRGQFWYTRTISSQQQWMPAGGVTIDRRGSTHRHGPNVLFDLRVSDETWVGVDGTIRDRMIVAGARFASAAGRAQWVAYRRPVPDFNRVWLGWLSHDQITVGDDRFPPLGSYQVGEWTGPSLKDVGDGLFNYRQLLSLPTRQDALRSHLRQAAKQLSQREARTTGADTIGTPTGAFADLSEIASLLTSPLPAAERLALYRAAVTIPGARVNPTARDSLARRGVAVSAFAGLSFLRMIFDPTSGALLEPAPNVVVVAQGYVGSLYALPNGVIPMRAPGAPPQPPTPAITPGVGSPTTVFTIRISAPTRDQSRPAPRLGGLLIGTPSPRCFASFTPRPVPLVASAGLRAASGLTQTYRLTPQSLHRHAWCRGRYELTVLPEHSPEPSPTTASSVYFQVR